LRAAERLEMLLRKRYASGRANKKLQIQTQNHVGLWWFTFTTTVMKKMQKIMKKKTKILCLLGTPSAIVGPQQEHGSMPSETAAASPANHNESRLWF